MVSVVETIEPQSPDKNQTVAEFLAQPAIQELRQFYMSDEELEKAQLNGFSPPAGIKPGQEEEFLYGRDLFKGSRYPDYRKRLVSAYVCLVAHPEIEAPGSEFVGEPLYWDRRRQLAGKALNFLVRAEDNLSELEAELSHDLLKHAEYERMVGNIVRRQELLMASRGLEKVFHGPSKFGERLTSPKGAEVTEIAAASPSHAVELQAA